MELEHARGVLRLDRCVVMGIVNRTPDSFFDGGRMALDEAVAHSLDLVAEGAGVLDLGAVKAGPGEPVDEGEEMRRLIPLVEALAGAADVPLSVETSRPSVAARAIAAGAAIVNDVTGLSDPGICDVCAETGAGLVVMHNGGQRRGRPMHPRYPDVVEAVCDELRSLADRAVERGVRPAQMIYDAGLDFGKTTYHSLELVRRTAELVERCSPYLVAASRKDVVGETLDLPVADRLEGSLAIAALSVASGAAVIRTHDVRATTRVVEMVEAVQSRGAPKAPLRGLWD